MKSLHGDLQLAFGTRAEPLQEGGRGEGGITEPAPQPHDVTPLGLPSKTKLRFLRILTWIVLAAVVLAVNVWLPQGPTWGGLSLTFVGAVLVLYLLPLTAAIITTARSRSTRRRVRPPARRHHAKRPGKCPTPY